MISSVKSRIAEDLEYKKNCFLVFNHHKIKTYG